MKVLLDLQPLMTGSRFRGIGRYTLNHAKSFIKQNNNDEIFLLINDSCSGSLEFVRKEFSEFVSDDHIVICRYPLSVFDSDIEWLKAGAAGAFELFQLIREAFISSLHPDFVLIYSHFEFAFSASSIKKYSDIPTGVIVYDFIPYHEKMFSGWMLDSYNEKIESLKNADIILCISDYISKDAESIIDVGASGAIKPIGTGKDGFWKNIDVSDEEKQAFFKKFGLDKDFILYAGGIEGRKNVKKLVEAYSLLSEEIKENNSLFIICGKHEKEQKELEQLASSCGISGHAVFGGYVSNEDLRMAYSLCRLFVFPSLSEGFGLTPLEAMSCGAPAIASDRTSIPEVIGMERALFDPEDAESIKAKIEEALTDEAFYGSLKSHALIQSEKFSWDSIASDTWKHIKDLFADKSFCDYDAIDLEDCIGLAADCLNKDKSWDLPLSDRLLKEISECIAGIYNENNEKSKKIFLELSVLDTVDAGSGIQRVSKNILKHLPSIAAGYDVVPVKMCNGGYEYCRKFASNPRSESFAYPSRNDLFFFPELSMLQITENINYFLQMKERGIRLVSMVYDLIPVKYPETCSDTVAEHFSEFLKSVALFDGVVCDSKAVADEYAEWMKDNVPKRHGICFTDWFHLGSDLGGKHKSAPSDDLDENVISLISQRKTFLMVSTIEPRKKYDQAIDAFDELWSSGIDINLVIVGKAGWKVEELIGRINSHKEKGKRLFWLSGISDAYLEKVYESSDCLIMASLSEGFGLAITEAAYRNKPLIVRNIPVFREIAGDNAFYFDGMDGKALADCIRKWLKLYDKGEHPKSDGIKSLTWRQSVEMLFDRLQRYI